MRTVLAVDTLLGHAIERKLIGTFELCCHEDMREHGADIVRVAVEKAPCVLAIGATKWNPLDLLERWRFPDDVPIVLILPKIEPEFIRRADQLGVFSVVPGDRTIDRIPTTVAAECVLAWAWRVGLRSRPQRSPSPPRPHLRSVPSG